MDVKRCMHPACMTGPSPGINMTPGGPPGPGGPGQGGGEGAPVYGRPGWNWLSSICILATILVQLVSGDHFTGTSSNTLLQEGLMSSTFSHFVCHLCVASAATILERSQV